MSPVYLALKQSSSAAIINQPNRIQFHSLQERSNIMNDQIVDKVQSYATKFTNPNFRFTPDIPQKKIRNAIKAYAPDASESEVLLLLDTTVFGSAKNGLLLTGDALYTHSILEKPSKVALKDINTITLEQTEYDKTTQSPEWDSWDMRINDRQYFSVRDINGQDPILFAQLLKELKALLMPGGEVVVNEITSVSREMARASLEMERTSIEIARASLVCQPRVVLVEGGKLKRYNFINLYPKGPEPTKIVNEHSELINPKVVFQGDTGKILAVTNSKNVSINGEPFSGSRQLVDGDLITLGKMTPVAYQFQANAVTDKQQRLEQESAQGVKRYEGAEKPAQVVHPRFIIDAARIKLRDDSGGSQYYWADIRSVIFSADYDFIYKATDNLGNAAGQGWAIGSATVEAMFKSQQLSDVWGFFPAPNYKVLIGGVKLEGIDQYACTMLDKGIELFAPMDLVIFSH